MRAAFSQQRLAPAIGASTVGIAVSGLMMTPFGLVAPIAALFLFARGRTALLLHAMSAVGLVGSLLLAGSYAGAMRDVAQAWAAFFAVALCIGVIVKSRESASVNAKASTRTATPDETPSYPVVGPTPREKLAPRNSPVVSVAARDDEATALWVAASFWGGTPFHLRYWRRLTDGSYRWSEIRTESLRESSGTQVWSGFSADIGDQGSAPQQPTKIASNPPRNDEAVQAAKIVERLLGNAWAFDASGRPTYLTPFAQTFVSVTLEEFQASVDEGHTVFKQTSHPDDYDRIATAWRHSLQTGDPFYIERRIRRASGIHDWSRTAIVPTRDRQGRITGWYGASMDLDAYRTVEVELLARERELSQLVDMVPSHIWRLTPDGDPVFFNKRMVDFLGFDIADTDKPGKSPLDAVIEAVHPSDAPAFRDVLNRCFATGETFALRYRLRRADGVYRWMSSRAEPMRDQDGRIVQWYGICHDIDDQTHAEEALRRSERQLQQLIDTVPAVIWCTTPAGIPCYLNKRATVVTGLTLKDLIAPDGSRSLTVVHPDDRQTFDQALARSFKAGTSFVARYRQRRADGPHRWVESRAEPLRDDSGNIVQWYGVSVDIDDLVTAQEALRQASDELAKATQAASLAELSASIAHEVNQPLAAIVANSHACQRWLRSDPPNLERAQLTVERIVRDANSAAEVVSRVRSLFRQAVEPRSTTTLASIVTEARNLMTEEATRRRVRIDEDIESDLPLVAFDRVQIQQVLINLIGNGMDAMDASAGDKVLKIRVRRMRDAVQTEISDRGRGIDFPDRIFEPFFTTKQNGMGMGLAICRSIVESHGGRLWMERNEPEGARFIFTLPVEVKRPS